MIAYTRQTGPFPHKSHSRTVSQVKSVTEAFSTETSRRFVYLYRQIRREGRKAKSGQHIERAGNEAQALENGHQ